MAGFMSGFGPAFSNAFNASREQSARERNDLFKMKYEQFVKRQDEVNAYKKEDAKTMRAAEALLARSGKPAEALPWVYNQLKAGLDASVVADDLEKGTFAFDLKEDKPADKSKSMPKDPMAEQMQGTGMAPAPSNQVAQAPAVEEDSYKSGPLDGLFGGRIGKMRKDMHAAGGTRRERYANSRMQEVTGKSQPEIDTIMAGPVESDPMDTSGITFTPPEVERKPSEFTVRTAKIEYDAALASGDQRRIEQADRVLKSAIAGETLDAEIDAIRNGKQLSTMPITIWKDGKFDTEARAEKRGDQWFIAGTDIPVEGNVVPVSEQELKEKYDVAQALAPEMKEHNSRAANMEGAVRSYGIMSDLVERSQGAVLAPVTSGLFQWAQKWTQDAATFAAEVNKMAGEGEELAPELEAQLQEYANKLQSEGDPNDLGTLKGLYETQKALLAFRLGSAMGQEGRNLAEAERKLFTEMAAGGVTPEKFHENMNNILMPGIRTIDSQLETILDNNSALGIFFGTYDYRPKAFEANRLMDKLETTEDVELKNAYQTLKTGKGMKTKASDKPEEQGNVPTVSTKEERDALPPGSKYLRKMPDGSIQEFTKQ